MHLYASLCRCSTCYVLKGMSQQHPSQTRRDYYIITGGYESFSIYHTIDSHYKNNNHREYITGGKNSDEFDLEVMDAPAPALSLRLLSPLVLDRLL